MGEETLLQTDNVRVRVMELAPEAATTWHRHSAVTDHMVGLSGRLRVELADPAEICELPPGQMCRVGVGRLHRVVNTGGTDPARYLLIQGVGRYDYQPVEPAKKS